MFKRLSLMAAFALSLPALGAGPDGSRDFDFETGAWHTELKRLREPLSGKPPVWVEYEGSSLVHAALGSRANLIELDVGGPAGRIEGVSLRLYQPKTGQWTLNFANLSDGLLTAPMTGSFRNGVGEFFGEDTFKGRPILVRFLILPVTRDVYRFEQAFSADGGKNWEVNWLATDTRLPP
ncbi:MAG: hypothetical protein V4463_12100 [Pseudomonadota bacterium]